jgi:hypothetical protein
MTVIRQKMALGIKLKGREQLMLEQHLDRTLYRRTERVKWEDGKVHFKKTFDAEPLFPAIKAQGELVNPRRGKNGALYLGSVDPITAANWSRECGAGIGTREFAAYAKKKLMNGEFSRFKAEKNRRFF